MNDMAMRRLAFGVSMNEATGLRKVILAFHLCTNELRVWDTQSMAWGYIFSVVLLDVIDS